MKKVFEPVVIPLTEKEKTIHMMPIVGIKKSKSIAELAPIPSAMQRLVDAKNLPDIKNLLSVIWQTNEIHILFADTGIGKSIYAVALSDSISKGKPFMGLENDNEPLSVLYYDFELSDKQFWKRYSDEFGNLYQFSERFYCGTIDFVELYDNCSQNEFNARLFEKICDDIEKRDAKVLVIDNISYLDMASTQDKNVSMEIMRELCRLKKKYSISILVLAHTPKRNQSSPITKNDLAGSKNLSNFCDSISAIGQSTKDSSLRYIKQVKPSRSSEIVYDIENVIVCKIVKKGAFLNFELVDYDSEYEHIQEVSRNEKQMERFNLIEEAKELRILGHTYEEIAFKLLGSTKKKGTIYKWLDEKE